MIKIFSHKIWLFVFAAVSAVVFSTLLVSAATTIGPNIQTDGTFSATGTSTLSTTFIGTSLSGPNSGTHHGLTITSNSLPFSILEIHNKYAVGIDLYTHEDAQFRAPFINFYKSRGTQASPTAVQSTGYELDSIGGINFGGWNGEAYAVSAAIYSQSDENWTYVGGNRSAGHLSIYGTQIGADDLRQFVQFGGLDGTDLDAQNRSGVTGNIVFYTGLSFNGNQTGNPALLPSSNPAVLHVRTANDTGDAGLTAGSITTSGKIGVSTSTPVANFQVANGTNATTTMEVGSSGQNKGSCLKLYRTDGSPVYAYVAAGATTFTLTTTACASVTNF